MRSKYSSQFSKLHLVLLFSVIGLTASALIPSNPAYAVFTGITSTALDFQSGGPATITTVWSQDGTLTRGAGALTGVVLEDDNNVTVCTLSGGSVQINDDPGPNDNSVITLSATDRIICLGGFTTGADFAITYPDDFVNDGYRTGTCDMS